MSASNRQVSVETASSLIGSVRKKGVRLWFDNGELRYKAPKGALTREEVDCIRASKDEIVSILRDVENSELEQRREVHLAPLTFSQLAHWRINKLHERPSMRQIVSATRVRGELNEVALRQSIAEMVRRHDALRTRIAVCDGEPTQQVAKSSDCEIETENLAAVPENSRHDEVLGRIEQFVLAPVDVTTDRLFGARLLKLSREEHVLILAMEHSIADGYSRGVLVRDVFSAYEQACAGEAYRLPPLPVQLADYAAWQRSTHASWLLKHGAYWDQRLTGADRLRFPSDPAATSGHARGWGGVPLRLGPDLKTVLSKWCRIRKTTLVMGVFAAYVALVLRWCNERDAVIRYQIDGRHPDLENAIGYFASVLHLRLELAPDDTFNHLLSKVVAEHLQAHEHADASYIDAEFSDRGFVRNGRFNWIPAAVKAATSERNREHSGLQRSAIAFQHPSLKNMEVDREPGVLLYDSEDVVTGSVIYPLNRFSTATMERFAHNLMLVVSAMLRDPTSRVMDLQMQ